MNFPYPTSKGMHHMSMRAHAKKRVLWDLACKGAPRPTDKSLSVVLLDYTSPSREGYDAAFSDAIREKAKHWWRPSARNSRVQNPFVQLFFKLYDAMDAESYKDVANRVGVSYETVRGWAQGRDFTRNLLTLHRLSTASGISIDEMALMLFEPNMEKAQ